MLECVNGSYYTGYTRDLNKRYDKHCTGSASKYTRSFPPIKIAACWEIRSICASQAMRLEAGIKKLSANQKKNLVSNATQLLHFSSLAALLLDDKEFVLSALDDQQMSLMLNEK